MNKKIKILCWMDSPAVSTGFGSVAKGIFKSLAETGKYEIDIIGINDRGGYKDPKEHPYHIFPARTGVEVQGDFHGRPRLIASLLGKDLDLRPPWDIVFTLNDPFVLEQPMPVFNKSTSSVIKETQEMFKQKLDPKFHFKTVSYVPIDSTVKGNWIENSINLVDRVVAYTEYGKKEIERADQALNTPTDVVKKTSIIYHGIDQQAFKVLPEDEVKKFKSKFFQDVVKDDTFLVVAVARNQRRKDLPRTLQIFKEFQRKRPDSFLYIHCQETDVWGSLREYARIWNLEFGKDWGVPAKFNANTGFPVEMLNQIYNSADAILSTSHGEGWGFYNTEGFATKTIVVAPDNTVHPEILGYDGDITDMEALYNQGVRGVPIKAGSTKSEWVTYGPEDLERKRPIVNVDDAVNKLVWIYDNPDKATEIENRAFEWVKNYTWKNIADQWDALFQDVYKELEDDRAKIGNVASAIPGSTPKKLK